MVARASARLRNTCSFRHSSRKRRLKDSTKAFWTGLPRRDVMPVEAAERPAQHRRAGQLAAVVADDHSGPSALRHQALQFAHHAYDANRCIDHAGQAFAAEVVDHAQDAKAPTIAECIGDEVERPASIDRIGQGERGARAWWPQALVPLSVLLPDISPARHTAVKASTNLALPCSVTTCATGPCPALILPHRNVAVAG